MAVYTKVSDAEASAFLLAYDLGAFQSLQGITQGVENSNYILTTTSGRYILTLYEKRTPREDLPFFLGLMEHVAKKGVPGPLPIRARDDGLVQELCGRAAAITGFLQGRMTGRITPEQCFDLGRALAQFHLAAEDFPMQRPNALSLAGWEGLYQSCHARADEVMVGLGLVLRDEMEFLKKHWPQNLPSGVIHADLFPDNVFFNDAGLCGLIDFYFACNDYWAYDLSICLNAWCFENKVAFNITKAGALMRGYQAARPLSAEELRAFPILARGSALRFHLTRLYDWLNRVPDALVRPKDPLEYIGHLQFHQRVRDCRDYGLDLS